MSNNFDDDEDVFEDMMADEDQNSSPLATSRRKVNSSTKFQQSASKILSAEELQAMEIKIDKVQQKNQILRQEIQSTQQTIYKDVEKLLTSQKSSKIHISKIFDEGQTIESSKPQLESVIQVTSQHKHSIDVEFNNDQSPKIQEDKVGESITNETQLVKDSESVELQKRIDTLESELDQTKKIFQQKLYSRASSQNQKEELIKKLIIQLQEALERQKDLQAEISFIKGNTESFSVSQNGDFQTNVQSNIRPTQSSYIQKISGSAKISPNVHESFIIDQTNKVEEKKDSQVSNTLELEKKIQQYELRITELCQSLENSQAELLETKKNAQKQINRLKETIKDNSRVIMRLTVEVDDLKTLNEKLSVTHTQNTETINSLNQNLFSLKEEISQKVSLITQKDEQINQKNQKITQRDQKAMYKQQQIKEKDNEIYEKENQLKQKDQLINQLNMLIKQKNQLIQQRDELIYKKDQQIRLRDDKIIQKQQNHEKIEQIERQLKEKFNYKVSQLMSQMKILNLQKDKITAEKQSKAQETFQLYQNVSRLQNQLIKEKTNKSSELQSFSRKIQQLENQIKTLRNQLAQIHEKNRKLQSDFGENRKDQSKQIILQLTEIKAQYQQVNSDLQSERQLRKKEESVNQQAQFSLNNQIQTLLAECTTLNKQILYLQQQNKNLHQNQTTISQLRGQVSSLNEKNSYLHKQSSVKDDQNDLMKSQLSQAQTRLRNYELKQISFNRKISEQKRVNQEQVAKIKEMQNDFMTLKVKERQIMELQGQLQAVKNPKTIEEKFQAIKGWFELNDKDRKYEYQSRSVQKVREKIELMNWIEEYFRMIISEALSFPQDEN